MTDSTPPPAEPRQRLLLAAEEVFANRGFDGATTREICEAAGMNGAAINYHFGDKERLYVATVRHAHQSSCGGEGMFARPVDATLPPVERFRQLVANTVSGMMSPVRTSALQLLMRELTQESPASRSVVDDMIRPMAHELGAILEELVPNLPEQRLCMLAYSVVGQCLFYRQNRMVITLLHGEAAINALTPDLVAEHIIQVTLAAIGLVPPLLPQTPRRKS